MAVLGAKMNPRSIELGAVYDMPVYVASSFSSEPGTLTMEVSKRWRFVRQLQVSL